MKDQTLRTELLCTLLRTTLAVIAFGRGKTKFDKETKSRGLFANVGSVTAGFIRVVQQWFRAKRQVSEG